MKVSQHCTIVVYSVLVISRQIEHTMKYPSGYGECSFLFTNVDRLRAQKWAIVHVPRSNISDRRYAKELKYNPPLELGLQLLYVDSKIHLNIHPNLLIDYMLNGMYNISIAAFIHPYVQNSIIEAGHIARMKRNDERGRRGGITDSADLVDKQSRFYKKRISRKMLNKLPHLYDTALFYANTSDPRAIFMRQQYLNEIHKFSDRDQVAQTWVMYQTFLKFNSIGLTLLPEQGYYCSFWTKTSCKMRRAATQRDIPNFIH
jgi:hypothetical protein